jgi:hypothetical protein
MFDDSFCINGLPEPWVFKLRLFHEILEKEDKRTSV